MLSSGFRDVWFVSSSGFPSLDQSLLVMPKLRSDFFDSCKFVVLIWIAPLGSIFIGGSEVTVRLI